MTIPAAGTVALLLADARLPSGGHAHSSGLEPALLGGMPPAAAADFLALRARTTALVDAGTAVAAMHAVLDGRDGSGLAAVERGPGRRARRAARCATPRATSAAGCCDSPGASGRRPMGSRRSPPEPRRAPWCWA